MAFPGHTHLRLTLHVVLLVFLCHSFDKVIDCNFSGHKHIFTISWQAFSESLEFCNRS